MPANHTYDACLISLSSGPVSSSAKGTPAGAASALLLASSSASVVSNKSSASSSSSRAGGHVIGAVPLSLPRI
ncbi:hypothetical protein HDU86_007919 [Geranomyces michiganensis]|nr:hypothetical protein HDU86_007919 [Geranomyces michiganensis]